MVWTATQNGKFSVQSAVNVIRKKQPKLRWYKKIWKSCIHPSTAGNIWKITRDVCTTDEKVKNRGMNLASRCYLCRKDQDNMEHILWNCDYGQILWKWVGGIFAFKTPKSFEDILNACNRKSTVIQEVWFIAAFNIMVDIWFTRNRVYFDNVTPNSSAAQKRISKIIQDCEVRLKGDMSNSAYDLKILKHFNLGCRKVKNFRTIECNLCLPADDSTFICCDGASRRNPDNAGYGFIARDSACNFLTAESGGLGNSTNFVAEIIGTINALEWAVKELKNKVIINSDSKEAVYAFSKNKLPWFIWNRWIHVCSKISSIHFNHVYREINFSADFFAKKGLLLAKGQVLKFNERPSNMQRMEFPGLTYYKFV
ncbi:uncharacterized protein LOC113360119 [Papaver somniferum]|uniref:uncharacterized protein LOC113360119 n=1 Tax=Papaver somniferum TaxID=3469 RepID=UPI000E6F65FA|nr:uncharacterized protein LOC113360119 [Papaver somniferum]